VSNPLEGSSNPVSFFPHSLISAAIDGKYSKHVRRGATAYFVALGAWKTYKQFADQRRTETEFVVSVSGDDELYDVVREWLMKQVPESKLRSIAVRYRSRTTSLSEWLDSPEPPPSSLHVFFDGSKEQTVSISGHKVKINLNQEDKTTRTDANTALTRKEEIITFTARDVAGRDSVLSELERLSLTLVKKREPRLLMTTRWGDWQTRSDLPKRNLKTVVLPEEQKERLVADLQHFFDNEARYDVLGLPWHRGYLFHGPPGTGKTSLARALGTHFALDVHYVSLSSLDSDANLIDIVNAVPAKGLLLLEDIDVVHGAKTRDDKARGISLSALLNALDGIVTPHGLITIMTTNDISVLDAALIRPGRADVVEEIGYLTDDQLVKLLELAQLPTEVPALRGGKITPADILEVIKQRLDEPEEAINAVRKLIKKRG
jgi:hypothetical protein